MSGPAIRPSDRHPSRESRRVTRITATTVVIGSLLAIASGGTGVAGWTSRIPGLPGTAEAESDGHLLISEVMVGGGSASDEFVEIYNPTEASLPLEGLELVYVSASGATVTRKAEWPAGAPGIRPGGHVLAVNEAGIFAALADASYAGGLAATGGSVALRIQGASTAIDSVGWGTAANAWLEGSPAPAVPAGHSLERLPGGAAGSGQDTDQNALDFIDQAVPEPQNAASSPIGPTPMPTGSASPTTIASSTAEISAPPVATASTSPTPLPTPSVTPSPSPAIIAIASARALPDGAVATVEGMSLTDGTFTDGGGYLVDATAGIAVLVSGGTFPRGHLVRVTGELDDRYQQRTLRAEPAGVVVMDPGIEPDASVVATGGIGEESEGELVEVAATVVSSASQLSGAVAFDLDDGSGAVRLVVMAATGIDHTAWERGTRLQLRGVVGQRDSSGVGTTGYRLYPREVGDVLSVLPPSTATPSPSASASGSPHPGPSADPSVVSIAVARAAPFNARVRVRGVVTLPTSVLGDGTAAVQDGSGAIVLRLGDEAGELALGELVQVDGVRSTKSGMETLRVSTLPLRLGTQAQPDAARHATGSLGEGQEAMLIVVRGSVATSPRRSSAQNVYFDVDDGSGPLRVYVSPRTGISLEDLALGTWVDLTGVLGQETSGQQPERGHRVWPRQQADVRVLALAGSDASATPGGATGSGGQGGELSGGGGSEPTAIPGAAAAGTALWPSDLPAPRLAASGAAVSRPTIAPTSPALANAIATPVARNELSLLLAAMAAALALAGAVAAARPGLLERVRDAIAARLDPLRPTPESDADGDADALPLAGSALEETVARLVPLPVVDDALRGEAASSTDSRSRVRRILPPT